MRDAGSAGSEKHRGAGISESTGTVMVVAVEYISKEESAGVEAAKHGVTGILAVQGAFAEHAAMLDHLGAPWKLLRAAAI